jgi:hypothetical protein
MLAGSDFTRYDVFKEWNSYNWFELTTTLLGHTGMYLNTSDSVTW